VLQVLCIRGESRIAGAEYSHAPNPELQDTKINIPLINVSKRILVYFWAVEKRVLIINWYKPITMHKLTFL
jgi:hypothetical protein